MQNIFDRCFIRGVLLGLLIVIMALSLSGCASKLHEVNRRVNSYKYSYDGRADTQTVERFYKNGGGSCLAFAKAKQAELGGEIVILPKLFEENGGLVTHAVLKVDGYLLDSRFNELSIAALQTTFPYKER